MLGEHVARMERSDIRDGPFKPIVPGFRCTQPGYKMQSNKKEGERRQAHVFRWSASADAVAR
jgi:hypothetical protein